MLNRFTPIKTALLSGSLILVLAIAAVATTRSSITLKGPASNKLGSNYTYTASGFAASPANFLAVFHPAGVKNCASTYDAEFRTGLGAGGLHVATNKSFSAKFKFTANVAGKRTVCAYLINFKSTKTYAHTSAHFTNHK